MKTINLRLGAVGVVVLGCSVGEAEKPRLTSTEQAVAVTDRALATELSSKTASNPVLCKADSCLVAELGTDLDAFQPPGGSSLLPEACADGQNSCSGGRCYACCNNTWYNINTCTWGVNFYCNGVHYNATSCWPCCE